MLLKDTYIFRGIYQPHYREFLWGKVAGMGVGVGDRGKIKLN